MKLNQEQLVLLLMDSIQVFSQKSDYFGTEENRRALAKKLPSAGTEMSCLTYFIDHNPSVSSWYYEAVKCADLLTVGLDEDANLDVDKLKLRLSIIDFMAGFSLLNLITGAGLDQNIINCLRD